MRVLIDTNIVLDYILNREPYGEQARNMQTLPEVIFPA